MIARSLSALFVASFLCTTSAVSAESPEWGPWKSLFNGKDTTGWQNAKPKEGHHAGPNRWHVEDGTLTQTTKDSKANDVCTVPEFKDYELEIEYKIPKGGNSGVYLRGVCEIQIYDSYGKKDSELSPADCGSIYGVGYVASKNTQKAPMEWNKYRVRHIGHQITVWHNGHRIHDHVYQPKRTGGAMSTYPTPGAEAGTAFRILDGRTGPIMLQGDHGKVWYKNIRVREHTPGDGWKPLWNGKDLSEYQGPGTFKDQPTWKVDPKVGAFTCNFHQGPARDLWTKESFGNFEVYYEYLADTRPGGDGNSGFYLRDQWEIQIHGQQRPKSKHHDGAFYSTYAIASARKASREKNKWNAMYVRLVDNKASVWQNGVLIHDNVELVRRTDSNRKTKMFSKAPFKLQGDHAKVWFTNLKIKPLPDSK